MPGYTSILRYYLLRARVTRHYREEPDHADCGCYQPVTVMGDEQRCVDRQKTVTPGKES